MKRSQALNYTPKAIEALRSYPMEDMPLSRAAYRWIADLLEQAEVFILPDCGELLDRSRPKPEVPGLTFKPPFPVVVCEYQAQRASQNFDRYNAVPCSRRIALAWEWTDDLPAPLSAVPDFRTVAPGVCVLSIFYVDATEMWLCNAAATYFPYDGQWFDRSGYPLAPFHQAAVERGDLPKALLKTKGYETGLLPLAIEHLQAARQSLGSIDAVIDTMSADNSDEVAAYLDLCYALACKNVTTERTTQSQVLNRERRRKGKPELKDFHLLSLGGAGDGPAPLGGDRNGPRSHLRRGHIRRLGADRITWVNQTMVHGHGGFVDKSYRMKGAA